MKKVIAMNGRGEQMDDLISRQKAIDAFHPDHDTDWYTPWIIETLNEIPSADVVEVVRCKDCKHYVLHTLFGRTQGWCERLCDKFDRSLAHGTEEDDFCSYGKKRDD